MPPSSSLVPPGGGDQRLVFTRSSVVSRERAALSQTTRTSRSNASRLSIHDESHHHSYGIQEWTCGVATGAL